MIGILQQFGAEVTSDSRCHSTHSRRTTDHTRYGPVRRPFISGGSALVKRLGTYPGADRPVDPGTPARTGGGIGHGSWARDLNLGRASGPESATARLPALPSHRRSLQRYSSPLNWLGTLSSLSLSAITSTRALSNIHLRPPNVVKILRTTTPLSECTSGARVEQFNEPVPLLTLA
ncbi:hypothetical protein J6590_009144 [Homalodisca vitripennis]|nr:hypothetical protein J6590_009144 [Homalodisca vitripennis]